MNKFAKKLLMPTFKKLAEPGIMNPHTPYEIKLMLAGVKPVAIIREDEILSNAKLQKAIAEERIVVAGKRTFEKSNDVLVVIAQKDKLDDGQEVFIRYYKNDAGYPPIEDIGEWRKHIGKLLGYTDKDITLTECNALQKLLTPIRAFARKECMLQESDGFKNNI